MKSEIGTLTQQQYHHNEQQTNNQSEQYKYRTFIAIMKWTYGAVLNYFLYYIHTTFFLG